MQSSTLIWLMLAMVASAQPSLAGCSDSRGFQDCSGDKNPCALMRCKEGTVCNVDNCGGCKARCEEDGMMHIAGMPENNVAVGQLNSKPGLCSDGSSPVQCLVDPCSTNNRCNNTSEVCEARYCGGCHAVCTPKSYINSRPKNSRPNLPAPKPSTVQPQQTPADATHTNSKPGSQPGAVTSVGQCPKGVQLVQCLVDPCQVNNKCNTETETCESNYCGGCNSVCRTKGKTNAAEPMDNPRPADSTCTRIPCGGIMCIRNTVCKNDWTSCRAVCVPSAPESNVVPPAVNSAHNQQTCGGVDPCAGTSCLTNTMCIADWKTCSADCVKLCNKGFGWDTKQRACRLCRPGYYTDVQSNTCAACPKDTYFKFDQSGRSCLPCPPGKSTKGKVGQLSCVVGAAGSN